MELSIAKLRFKTPVRFGQEGIGLEKTRNLLHSDTLFSSLVCAWSEIYGLDKTSDVLELFKDEPPLIISSAFPWSGKTLMLPKPFIKAKFIDPIVEESYSKKIKKLNFVTKETFEVLINGKPLEKELLEETLKNQLFEYLTKPFVSLDRVTYSPNIYYVTSTVFRKRLSERTLEEGGVYFFFRVTEKNMEEMLKSALLYLGDTGIGGKKSCGYGKFEYEIDRISLDTPDKPDSFITLSLAIPNESELFELDHDNAFYHLIRRRGWIVSPFFMRNKRKKAIYCFTEGSVFPAEFRGRMVDVTPREIEEEIPHRVYRYGYPFWIPVRRVGNG
jgi:CRISPR-associated protein Csm4